MPPAAVSSQIAILGWGSLVWDPRGLPLKSAFEPGSGPKLPLEFSRISSDGRITLVIDPTDGAAIGVRAALSARPALADAVADLRDREGTAMRRIGFASKTGRHSYLEHPDHQAAHDLIFPWLQKTTFDAVVWTALPPNFLSERGIAFSVPAAITYLNGLAKSVRTKAAEYIDRAPPEVATPLRKAWKS